MLIRAASSMFKTAECTAFARRALIIAVAVAGLLVAQPYRSIGAEKTEARAYNGAAVTVVRAKRSCFADTISVSGMLVPREEVAVRPEREGLQIS
jgi:multidrug efflux pump subunit AcrA (membrane-fusion protein)